MLKRILTILSFFMFHYAEAEIDPTGGQGWKYVLNDEKASFSLSMNRFQRVYVGQFKIKRVYPNDVVGRYKPLLGQVFIESNFHVFSALSALKGGLPSRDLEVKTVGFHACIDRSERKSLISKIKLFSDRGFAGARKAEKMFAELSKQQSGDECFLAVYIIQGDPEEAYKARYELIFENTPYTLFTNDLTSQISSIEDLYEVKR